MPETELPVAEGFSVSTFLQLHSVKLTSRKTANIRGRKRELYLLFEYKHLRLISCFSSLIFIAKAKVGNLRTVPCSKVDLLR